MWPCTEAKRITAGMDLAVQHVELSSLEQEIKCTNPTVSEGSVLQPSVQAFIVKQK